MEGLSDEQRDCREGHMMKRWSINDEGSVCTEVWRCQRRCGTRKIRTTNSNTGLILSTHYEYPEGYLRPKGSGRLDIFGRGAVRLVAQQAFREKQAARQKGGKG